jgi:hypothetical protein
MESSQQGIEIISFCRKVPFLTGDQCHFRGVSQCMKQTYQYLVERGKMDNLSIHIRVITKLPNSEQSYKGKVKTHKYIDRQNQSTTGKL